MNPKRSIQRLIIGMAIAGLVLLACQGASGFNLFATETPTPTLTFTPSLTLTPSPTLTPTPTRTPSPTPSPKGVVTEEQSDGSILFIDYDNHYQFKIPESWFVIPLSSGDIVEIMKELTAESPEFKDVARAFMMMNPDIIRVVALHKDTKYIINGFSTNITVAAIEDKLTSGMPLDFITGALEESLKRGGATLVPNQELASDNANGVAVGTLEFQQTAPTAIGTQVQVHVKFLVFQANGKLITIQVAAPKQVGKEILPVLEQIVDTIKLLKS